MSSDEKALKRAVFLDRDGVVNETFIREGKPYPPRQLSELKIFEDVASSVEAFHKAGFLVIIVTNQPDLSKGLLTLENLQSIHNEIQTKVKIDQIRFCPHEDYHDCSCRKPKAGMLLDASNEWEIDLSQSFMVGDRWKDIDAGKAAGCKTVWINRNKYQEKSPLEFNASATSLAEAIPYILGEVKNEESKN